MRDRTTVLTFLLALGLLGSLVLSHLRAQDANTAVAEQLSELQRQLDATTKRLESRMQKARSEASTRAARSDSPEELAELVAQKLDEKPLSKESAIAADEPAPRAVDTRGIERAQRAVDEAIDSGEWTLDNEREVLKLLGAAGSEAAAQEVMQRVSVAINRGELTPEPRL